MSKEPRKRSRSSQEAEADKEITPDAVEVSNKPEPQECPFSEGKGGRYTMKDGKRFPRTD